MLWRGLVLITVALKLACWGAQYAVVVDKELAIEKLSKKQIKDIFMMKRQFVQGLKVVPVNIGTALAARKVFEKKILKTNRQKLNRYWVKQHFQGVRPPVVQESQQAMKLFVKNVKGAVGYLPLEAVDGDLKVIYEF